MKGYYKILNQIHNNNKKTRWEDIIHRHSLQILGISRMEERRWEQRRIEAPFEGVYGPDEAVVPYMGE
jgi:hypothetical protein